jgi:molybdopterin converting factor small subunit
VTLTANHANAGDVAERLAIAAEDIALVFVNGRRAGLDAALANGDRIAFAPAVGGM